MVPDDELAALVADARHDLVQAGEALVRAANAHGGEDNITVVLFEIGEGEADTMPPGSAESVLDDAGHDGGRPAADHLEQVEDEPSGGLRRHGAGKGGRLPAIVLVLAVVAIGLLVLYWGATR
jgi:hypothetical protein